MATSTTTTVTLRIDKSLKKRLVKLASATARSSSWLAAHALETYVESQEWQIAEMEKGERDMHAGRTVPHEKVKRWLKSWGTKRPLKAPTCD